jgi:hypothetical protein
VNRRALISLLGGAAARPLAASSPSCCGSNAKRIHRIMRAAPWPEPVRDAEEVFLVDRTQQGDHRPLDELVLQRGDRERALPAVRFGYVDPPGWPCPIRSTLDPVMQVREIALEVCLVVLPTSHHPRRSVPRPQPPSAYRVAQARAPRACDANPSSPSVRPGCAPSRAVPPPRSAPPPPTPPRAARPC